ncbi:MAG: leucine-rich repeat protein [Paludibacteraceae bacterium]|nr:leucine-rich repeat protein [Paludibacteraceae bacterium]
MKQIFSIILITAIWCSSVNAELIEQVQIGDLYYDLYTSDNSAEVTYKSYEEEYNVNWNITTAHIPSTVRYNGVTYNVTGIGGAAFNNCSKLTDVDIPNSITYIDAGAFADCVSLTSIEIPNSVTAIGSNAFFGCAKLASVKMGNSVTAIGSSAFFECSSLESLTIPNSVKTIGQAAFNTCTQLTSINIPSGVTSLGAGAFADCSNLKSITIPGSITNVENNTFFGCLKLSVVKIEDGVTSIGNNAFFDCNDLTSITIPHSVRSVGEWTFAYCINLKNVVLGASVASIGKAAFSDCGKIQSITSYCATPPTLSIGGNYPSFPKDMSTNTIIYVPADYLSTYITHDFWGAYDVRAIGASASQTTQLMATPSENSVDVVWPSVNNAESYELEVLDKDKNTICTLIFNESGQLISIAFRAPSHNNASRHSQATGFAFTVTGLNSGTKYQLTMTSKDGKGIVLAQETMSIQTTNNAQGIKDVNSHVVYRKRLVNGNLIVECENNAYNVWGVKVK